MNKKHITKQEAHDLQTRLRAMLADPAFDPLASDAHTAWKDMAGEEPFLPLFESTWIQTQVEHAALRLLRAAAPLSLALDTVEDRRLLVKRLPENAVLADQALMAWIQSCSSWRRRLLRKQGEQCYPALATAGYRAIATEATRLGWPKYYKEDLTVHDLKTLSSPGAPQNFWWGIRSTGTDLYRPNTLFDAEWAIARSQQPSDEQHYYAFEHGKLSSVTSERLLVQLVTSLDRASYEAAWKAAQHASEKAKDRRWENGASARAYHDAAQKALQAQEAVQRVERLKQHYH